ncbi:MAG: hypothetical protein L0H73_14730 [Nitrococcus sp.]|nr:hypothetical protein [Nitrococcus sp.]
MGTKGCKGFPNQRRVYRMLCLLRAYLLDLHTARAGPLEELFLLPEPDNNGP